MLFDVMNEWLIILLVQAKNVYNMGQCNCCPFIKKRKPSIDSLSLDTQHPSVDVQLPLPIQKKGKKINNKQLKILTKQQSAYFQQTNRQKLQSDCLNTKIIPLLGPKHNHNQILLQKNEKSQISNMIKQQIKPQIMKHSTMDQQTSQENHYNNRQNFEESSQNDHSLDGERQEKGKQRGDMTFSGRQETIVIGKQFRTHQEEIGSQKNPKEQAEKLKEMLKENNISTELRCQMLYKLSKWVFQYSDYAQVHEYLYEASQLLKDIQSSSLKFQILSFYGCILLLQQHYTEAIPLLLKAIRMQVAKQGVQSVRLVQLYYWLGECYLQTRKGTMAKEYLIKSLRGYTYHSLIDPQLLKRLYLQLGLLFHSQEEFPQADKYYGKGIKVAQENKSADKYIQLLLKRAENYLAMENYKLSLTTYANTFKALRKYNMTSLIIYSQSRKSLIDALKLIFEACISQSELLSVIKSAQECIHGLQQVKKLKERLKKMRAILYRQ